MSRSVNPHPPSEVAESHDEREYVIRTEAMLNSLGEGLIVSDKHGAITTINAYALQALGYEEKELMGKWMPKSIIAVDEFGRTLETLERPIIKSLTTGQTISSYSHYLTKGGDVIPVHITVSPVIVNDLPAGAIEVFRDLTREHQLDVAKDEFVSLASHQLRTPATAVKSILSMLGQGDFGPLTPKQSKYVQKAIESNDRQLQVIEDLLNVALVDSGKMELDLDYIDLASLISDAVVDHIDDIQARGQTVELHIPERLKLLGDLQKLRMAVDNLISNASKYSPEGGSINILLENRSDQARMSIVDQGVGIAADELPRVFAKFSRLPNDLSSTVGGTGLGLFLTKHIVELHRGVITVQSVQGVGSTFTVELPTRWGAQV